MAIIDDVTSQIKDAMRAKDADRLRGLRGIRAAFIEEMKKDGAETVSDDTAQAVLRRLAKQRVDSMETYEKAGREDLAAVERSELAVIDSFLPQLADEAQTRAWAEAAIAQVGASGPGDMGKVMGVMMKQHRAVLDGKITKSVVMALLRG